MYRMSIGLCDLLNLAKTEFIWCESMTVSQLCSVLKFCSFNIMSLSFFWRCRIGDKAVDNFSFVNGLSSPPLGDLLSMLWSFNSFKIGKSSMQKIRYTTIAFLKWLLKKVPFQCWLASLFLVLLSSKLELLTTKASVLLRASRLPTKLGFLSSNCILEGGTIFLLPLYILGCLCLIIFFSTLPEYKLEINDTSFLRSASNFSFLAPYLILCSKSEEIQAYILDPE